MNFLFFEIRKNLDFRKILVTPKIFLKSRFHCTIKKTWQHSRNMLCITLPVGIEAKVFWIQNFKGSVFLRRPQRFCAIFLTLLSSVKTLRKIAPNFFGLLRKAELYTTYYLRLQTILLNPNNSQKPKLHYYTALRMLEQLDA